MMVVLIFCLLNGLLLLLIAFSANLGRVRFRSPSLCVLSSASPSGQTLAACFCFCYCCYFQRTHSVHVPSPVISSLLLFPRILIVSSTRNSGRESEGRKGRNQKYDCGKITPIAHRIIIIRRERRLSYTVNALAECTEFAL